ncbi:MAG: hypothetical protein GX893_07445 [Firmicutes bacterium]|nr:hypothetical protein [Bacillota bacterium]
MSMQDVILCIQTDRTQYLPGDNVAITVTAKKGEKALAQEKLKLSIFTPDGKKIFAASLQTDDNGKAIALYHLRNKDESGSYYIEVQNQDHYLALSSFIVLNE